jgi:hypothetical protein
MTPAKRGVRFDIWNRTVSSHMIMSYPGRTPDHR